MFTAEVIARLGFYVYRLVDPRSGRTFYVGKGTGNRVFAHAAGSLPNEAIGMLPPKIHLIAEIRNDGLEVEHHIHRHGLDEPTAFHVEAALIDAYPGLTNAVGGHHSDELGSILTSDLQLRLQAPEAVWQHQMLIVAINRTAAARSTYDAARYAWKVGRRRDTIAYVLAVRDGLIVDVFAPTAWLPATLANFPNMTPAMPDRHGFYGLPAPDTVRALYLNKRLPIGCNLSQHGIRYVGPV